MDVQLKLSTQDDAHIIKNLWPLYQHEVSEFDGQRPNAHGLFGVDDSVTTLAEHGESQNAWWTDPKSLFPYLILADGHPAGFNLITARSRLPEEFDVDFVVYEFFVLHAFRGHGVAERAALDGFARHPGKWEIVTYPSQARAISFWRKVVKQAVGMGSAGMGSSETGSHAAGTPGTDGTATGGFGAGSAETGTASMEAAVSGAMERVGDHPWGRKVIFTFDNSR